MRVISQNKEYDIPYEHCTLWKSIKNIIYATPIGEPDSTFCMAKYSTQEKAEKAMKLLHEGYTGNILLINRKEVTPVDRAAAGEISWAQALTEMNCNKIVSIQPESKIENVWNWNIVFQFPAEDEI